MSNFYKTMIHIGLPIALSHLMTSGLNLVDTLMIGGLGETAIAGVGIANRLFFLFSLSIYGVYSGCGIFTAQYWGRQDVASIRKVMGIMLVFGGAIGLVFTAGSVLAPRVLLDWFSNDPQAIAEGAIYLRVVGISYLFTAVSFMYAFTSRSVHQTLLPMVVSGVALLMNTGLNYVLIYGVLGFPRMGVVGAAVATVIARVFELLALVYFIYKNREHPLRARVSELMSFDRAMLARVIKTGYPVFVNEATWALGNTVYFIAYGMIGTGALTVVTISYTVADLFQALFMGIGNACGVMVGNDIGRGDMDKAFADAKRFLKLTAFLSLGIVFGTIASRHWIAAMYGQLTPETTQMLLATLIVTGIYQLPKMFTFTMIVGILRSGGDTHFCMLLDLATVWLVGVPLSFFTAGYLGWPVHLVVAAVFFEEWVKVVVTLPRFMSRKWMSQVIEAEVGCADAG